MYTPKSSATNGLVLRRERARVGNVQAEMSGIVLYRYCIKIEKTARPAVLSFLLIHGLVLEGR